MEAFANETAAFVVNNDVLSLRQCFDEAIQKAPAVICIESIENLSLKQKQVGLSFMFTVTKEFSVIHFMLRVARFGEK